LADRAHSEQDSGFRLKYQTNNSFSLGLIHSNGVRFQASAAPASTTGMEYTSHVLTGELSSKDPAGKYPLEENGQNKYKCQLLSQASVSKCDPKETRPTAPARSDLNLIHPQAAKATPRNTLCPKVWWSSP
jgi:hypothetical protein